MERGLRALTIRRFPCENTIAPWFSGRRDRKVSTGWDPDWTDHGRCTAPQESMFRDKWATGYYVRERKCGSEKVIYNYSAEGINWESQVRKEFWDCLFCEGERLPATGRVRHKIDLMKNYPVYVRAAEILVSNERRNQWTAGRAAYTGDHPKLKSQFCSPLWMVPKKSHLCGAKPRFRLAVDYQELNRITKPEWYSYSRIEKMFDRMKGAKMFCVIDLESWYHQVRITRRIVSRLLSSTNGDTMSFWKCRAGFGMRHGLTALCRFIWMMPLYSAQQRRNTENI